MRWPILKNGSRNSASTIAGASRPGYEAVAEWLRLNTGRPLDKRKLNLSIVPAGITDFGAGDKGGLTAIDLVMRARDCGFDDAFAWLSERTGWGPAVAINLEPRKTIVINGVTADAETGEIIDETGEYAITDVYFDGDAPPAPVPLLIEPLLPREGLTFLGGQSGAGKSSVAIDMSAALSSEQRFFDYNIIERCAVIYVAAEGGATVPARLAAAQKARDIAENLPVAVIRSVPDLANANQRKAFIAKLRAVAARLHAKSELRVGCVMLDTLAAAFGIKDEN